MQRLRKRSSSPEPLAYGRDSSLSPAKPHAKPNAFEALLRGAAKAEKVKKLGKSDFVEAEAQESDDDDMLGFAGKGRKDEEEEEDGEELDQPLEGLVDDAVMDAETEAAELVQEKAR